VYTRAQSVRQNETIQVIIAAKLNEKSGAAAAGQRKVLCGSLSLYEFSHSSRSSFFFFFFFPLLLLMSTRKCTLTTR
jgi:hypothetical protein